MRVLMEYYGRIIMEGMVVILLIGMLLFRITDGNGNQGINAIIGGEMELACVDYHSYIDFREVYKAESEKKAPTIYLKTESLEVGIHNLSNYVKAVGDDGNVLNVQIRSIKAPDKTEVIGAYDPATGEVYLNQLGIYTVYVFAKADSNKFTYAEIYIPVNNEKGML